MLKLIEKDEKLVKVISGAKFYYRRITPIERQNIIKRNTHRGETDWWQASIDMLELCLKGWEGVGTEKGEVPYSPELINQLPDEVLSELMDAIGAAEVIEKK